MAHLTIDGKDYAARCDFAFDRTANEKYAKEDKNGDKSGGTLTIYNSLLNDDAVYLSAFWDCALAHLKKASRLSSRLRMRSPKSLKKMKLETPLMKW
ncbi:tail assembly chaperone [Bacillus stercoris]|nr:tail assembly chaperone [Bacillus stercoris]